MVDRFEMRWPVLDSKRTRVELMREAAADLTREFGDLGLRAVSAPAFKFYPGSRGPMLVAEVSVVTLPRNAEAWAG